MRNADASFNKKKNEIESRIKDYQTELNQVNHNLLFELS